MPSLDARTAEKIASTLSGWGWRVVAKSRTGHYAAYPPDGGKPVTIAAGGQRSIENTYAALRRAGVEFDPSRRQPRNERPATRTARRVAPTSPAPTQPARPVAKPLPAQLPGWAQRLRLSSHALQRAAQRGVSPDEIRAGVAYPDYTHESRTDPNATVAYRGDLKIVYTEQGDVLTVADRDDDRDQPRSPIPMPAPPAAEPWEIDMSTSDQVKAWARKAKGEFTPADISAATGASSGLASAVLEQLRKAGEIRRVRRGVYVPAGYVEAVEAPAPVVVERKVSTVDDMETGFAWAAAPPARVSQAAQQRARLVALVEANLDALKNSPGRWATLATLPDDQPPHKLQERAQHLRKAFPGLTTRVAGHSLYVAWEG